MKTTKGVMLALLFPIAMTAQTNQPLQGAAKADSAAQLFIFPDNIQFSRQQLNEKVLEKTKELTRCIELLAQKKDPNYRVTIQKAMSLFNNDERKMVTVTGKRYPRPVTKPVRTYLNDLSKLKYDKVSVDWNEALYVSRYIKQPNGTYTALVVFEQQFTGINAGEANYTYRDMTEKRIEITVKVWDKEEKGVITKAYMDVFLGNIGVTEL
jgi:hypothetical protein